MRSLTELVASGDAKGLRDLLDKYDWTPDWLTAAMLLAVNSDRLECAKVLLNHHQIEFKMLFSPGVKFDQVQRYIKVDDVERVTRWLNHGASDQADRNAMFICAARYRSYRCLQMMIEHPLVKVDAKDGNGATILHAILSQYKKRPSNESLLDLIPNVCKRLREVDNLSTKEMAGFLDLPAGESKWSVLHWAVDCELLDVVKVLLYYGADINIDADKDNYSTRYDNQTCTPLLLALQHGNATMACSLIELGATIHKSIYKPDTQDYVTLGNVIEDAFKSKVDQDAIIEAMVDAATGCRKMACSDARLVLSRYIPTAAKALIEHGPALFILDHKTDCLVEFMFMCALFGDVKYLIAILEQPKLFPIDINDYLADLDTVQEIREIVLYSSAVDPYESMTPLQLALRGKCVDVIKILLRFGANPDFVIGDKVTVPPICHIELLYNTIVHVGDGIKCFKVLLRHGCQLNCSFSLSEDSDPIYLLDFFIICGNLFICRLLWLAGATMCDPHLDREIVDEDEIGQSVDLAYRISDKEAESFYKDTIYSVPKLSQLARLNIRSQLSKDIENKISKLELPEHVRSFLNLEEWDGNIESACRDYMEEKLSAPILLPN